MPNNKSTRCYTRCHMHITNHHPQSIKYHSKHHHLDCKHTGLTCATNTPRQTRLEQRTLQIVLQDRCILVAPTDTLPCHVFGLSTRAGSRYSLGSVMHTCPPCGSCLCVHKSTCQHMSKHHLPQHHVPYPSSEEKQARSIVKDGTILALHSNVINACKHIKHILHCVSYINSSSSATCKKSSTLSLHRCGFMSFALISRSPMCLNSLVHQSIARK